MRELWWMARAAWQPWAQLTSILAMPEEGGDPFTADDFNPFRAGAEKKRGANLKPYDAQHLKMLQDSM